MTSLKRHTSATQVLLAHAKFFTSAQGSNKQIPRQFKRGIIAFWEKHGQKEYYKANRNRLQNSMIYHNPTRQRGIYANTAQNAKAQSLADAAGWDRRKCETSKRVSEGFIITRRVSEGFTQTLPKTQKHNPSLTQRVGIDANAKLQNASARDLS